METIKIHKFIDPSDYNIYELNGNVYMDKGDWPERLDKYDFGFEFFMGPSVTKNNVYRLSDSIYLNIYLTKLAYEMGISIDVDVAENHHMIIDVESKRDAEKIYNDLKGRIEKDFTVVNHNTQWN